MGCVPVLRLFLLDQCDACLHACMHDVSLTPTQNPHTPSSGPGKGKDGSRAPTPVSGEKKAASAATAPTPEEKARAEEVRAAAAAAAAAKAAEEARANAERQLQEMAKAEAERRELRRTNAPEAVKASRAKHQVCGSVGDRGWWDEMVAD